MSANLCIYTHMNTCLAPGAGQRLKDMASHERPQERLERLGASALSDTELLAMLLRSGSKDMDVMAVSRQMMLEAGSLAGLLRWDENDFRKVKGIGHIKALQLMTVTEVARRVLAQRVDEDPLMDSPAKVFNYLQPRVAGLDVEKFWTLCLNRKNRLVRVCEVSSGTVSNSLVHSREVFRDAIRSGASAMICVHNHPTGDPSPSGNDNEVTRLLRQSGELLGIQVLDHVIVGTVAADPQRKGYFSFQKAGLLNSL